MVIGGSPGGTTDNYARPLIDGLKALEPTLTILTQNVQGGGGSLALAEVASARPGSITLAVIQTNPIYDILMQSAAIGPDLATFHAIGSFTHDQRLIALRAGLDIDSLAGLAELGRPIVTPVSGQGTPASIESYLLSAMTNLQFDIVLGTDDALRRTLLLAGDIDIILNSYVNLKDLIEAGELVPVLLMSPDGYPPELDHVPALAAVTSAQVPAQIVEMIDSLNRLGRLLMAGPNTDAAAIEALRRGFDEVMESDALKEAYRRFDLVWAPTTGADVEDRMATLVEDPAAAAVFRAYVECGRREVETGASLVCGLP